MYDVEQVTLGGAVYLSGYTGLRLAEVRLRSVISRRRGTRTEKVAAAGEAMPNELPAEVVDEAVGIVVSALQVVHMAVLVTGLPLRLLLGILLVPVTVMDLMVGMLFTESSAHRKAFRQTEAARVRKILFGGAFDEANFQVRAAAVARQRADKARAKAKAAGSGSRPARRWWWRRRA